MKIKTRLNWIFAMVAVLFVQSLIWSGSLLNWTGLICAWACLGGNAYLIYKEEK